MAQTLVKSSGINVKWKTLLRIVKFNSNLRKQCAHSRKTKICKKYVEPIVSVS